MDVLYASSGSSSLVAAIALHTCEHEYAIRPLTLGPQGAGDEDYAAISPLRRVPVLRTEHETISELCAIIHYLDQLHPEAQLLPRGLAGRTQAWQWLSYCLTEALPVFRSMIRPERLLGDDQTQWGTLRHRTAAVFTRVMEVPARLLDERDFLVEEGYCIADALLAAVTGWARLARLPIADDPSLERHAHRVNGRPEVQRAHEKHGVVPRLVGRER